MTTPRLGAPELVSGQATPETTVNEQIRYIESGAGHFIFKDRDLATPPGSPADGDCYLVAASGTGDWTGHDGEIAFYVNTAWAFITAIEGFTAWVNDENVFIGYDGAAWNTLASPSGVYQPLDADLTTIAGLADPNADRILFWDDSAGAYAYLTAGTGLTITGTTIDAAAGAGYTDEQARDAIGTALVAGAGITVTVNDGADTITIANGPLTVSTQSGTSYTAVAGDANTYIRFTSASAVAFTIPPNSSVAFATGTRIRCIAAGAGTVTLTPGSGVTLNSRGALLASAGQYAVMEVVKVATDTWDVAGDVA